MMPLTPDARARSASAFPDGQDAPMSGPSEGCAGTCRRSRNSPANVQWSGAAENLREEMLEPVAHHDRPAKVGPDRPQVVVPVVIALVEHVLVVGMAAVLDGPADRRMPVMAGIALEIGVRR